MAKRPEPEKPADLHLCTLRCRLNCTLGHHDPMPGRLKCRCCGEIDHRSEQEQALGQDWSGLTVRWWK